MTTEIKYKLKDQYRGLILVKPASYLNGNLEYVFNTLACSEEYYDNVYNAGFQECFEIVKASKPTGTKASKAKK